MPVPSPGGLGGQVRTLLSAPGPASSQNHAHPQPPPHHTAAVSWSPACSLVGVAFAAVTQTCHSLGLGETEVPLAGLGRWGGLSVACTQRAAHWLANNMALVLRTPFLAMEAPGQGGQNRWSIRAPGQKVAGGFVPSSALVPPLWIAPPVVWAAGSSLPPSLLLAHLTLLAPEPVWPLWRHSMSPAQVLFLSASRGQAQGLTGRKCSVTVC